MNTPQFSPQWDWFKHVQPVFEKYLLPLAKTPPVDGLEIGCLEGRSTCWLLENVCCHRPSSIWSVDPFKQMPDGPLAGVDMQQVGKTFRENIQMFRAKEIGYHDLFTMSSRDFYRQGFDLDYSFDFAFIDGSHAAPDVLCDAVGCYDRVRPDGLLIFDDYLWDLGDGVKRAVDAFLSIYSPEKVEVIEKGYVVVCRKVA